MRNYQRVGPALLAALLLVGSLPLTASAQDEPMQAVRTLVIKNSQVLIDGKEVDASEIPKSLRLDSMSVSYSFIGIDEPVVNLKNHFFAVRANRLELIPAEFEFPAEFRVSGKRAKTGRVQTQELGDAKGWIVDADKGEYYSFQGERLEANEAVTKLLNEANNLYLDGLQQRNQSLFSRLSRERVLEHEAARLVEQVRASSVESERETLRNHLAAKLGEIFEFKQQNRRAEIAQFEKELARLRDRLERREAQKDRLIHHRIQILTQEEKNN